MVRESPYMIRSGYAQPYIFSLSRVQFIVDSYIFIFCQIAMDYLIIAVDLGYLYDLLTALIVQAHPLRF